MDLKSKLLLTGYVEDNAYLSKYVQLVYDNRSRVKEVHRTQRHHILPVCYFAYLGLPVDNTRSNVVNLLQRDHLLAHYYLFFIFTDTYLKQSMFYAIQHISGCKSVSLSEKQFISSLTDYQLFYEQSRKLCSENNCMYNEDVKRKHEAAMSSIEVKNKISKTVKELRKLSANHIVIHKGKEGKRVPPSELDYYLSNGWEVGSKYDGCVYMHKDSVEVRVYPDEVQKYLIEGWIQGGKPGRVSEKHRNALAKSHYKEVYCINECGNELARFNSVLSAAEWWYANGYGTIKRKLPKDYKELSNVIKYSSDTGKYIEGVRWIYEIKGGDVK